jgi:uncharacterized protein (TIGR02391 family)
MGDVPRHFTSGQIEEIAKILGDTNEGLTGSEIGHLLKSCDIPDTHPELTKWKRLYNAFAKVHNTKGRDNDILRFVARALEPSKYTRNHEQFYERADLLNRVLVFVGLEYQDDGKFHTVKSAASLSDATDRAKKLFETVKSRGLHPDLQQYCRAELTTDNYYHAVLEAAKGVAMKLRTMTGVEGDGASLVDRTLLGATPPLLINPYETESEISEQKGFANLLKGLFGVFRNPTAHELRAEWSMSLQDALDFFGIASYAMRRLDQANIRDHGAG